MTRYDIRVVVLLISLSLTLSSAADDSEEEAACSHKSLKYLCENYDTCSKYGLIDEPTKNTLCSSYLDDPDLDEPDLDDPEFPTTPPVLPPTRSTIELQSSRPTVRGSITVTTPDRLTDLVTEDDLTSDTGIVTKAMSTSYFHTRDVYTLQTTNPTGSTGPTGSRDNSYTTHSAYSTEGNKVVTEKAERPLISGRSPEITLPPVNITVAPGGTGQFVCTAQAATTPQITITKTDQTYKPSLDSFQDKTEHEAVLVNQTTINSITINNVDQPNEGWYTCLACNRHGCAEHDAYLHVKDLCDDVICPGDKVCVGNYDEGEGHTCQCPQYCDYKEFTVNDWVCSNYCEDHFNECLMKADACENGKSGIDVLSRGRCGRIEQPEILEQEMELGVLTLMEGQNLVLECNAIGFPEPQIVWYRDEEVVGHGNIYSKRVVKSDEGNYFCQAVNCMTTTVNRMLAIVYVNLVTVPPTTSPTPPPITDEPIANLEVDAPRSTCAVFGDPHFLSFDLNAYSYMGKCDNVLAMDCEMGRWFIYGRMRPCGRSGGSCLETVTAYVDSEVLELQRGWLVNRDGAKVVPKNHKNEVMEIVGKRNNFTLLFDGTMLKLTAVLERKETDPGTFVLEKLVLLWDGFVSVEIQVPEKTMTCGMCGNNDGKTDNDMRTRRKGMTDDPTVFGDSWRIDPRRRCEDAQQPQTPEEVCGARYEEVKAECERIFNIDKFKECIIGGHDTAVWIDSCIYDECEGGMQVESLPPKCVVANAYAIRCGEPYWVRGQPEPRSYLYLEGWEEEAQCPDSDERYQPVLDTGCPQPSLEEEMAANAK